MQDNAHRRIIISRPAHDGERWATDFARHGLETVLLPLIEITPAPAAAAQGLLQAWHDLSGFRAAMFVSANAVQHFFAARPADVQWPELRAWAPGPGTVRVLQMQGVPAKLIDGPAPDASQFDSESLWDTVQGQVRGGDQVLVVRGGDAAGLPRGRDWLATQITEAGGSLREIVAYARRTPAWTDAQKHLAARSAGDGSVWLFSSSEAIANLLELLPGQDWQHASAVATHPRIAQAARQAGFGVVRESRPGLEEIVASIESPNDH